MICKNCKKQKNGYCMISSKPINKFRKSCTKFKSNKNYKQESLFDAVGNSK